MQRFFRFSYMLYNKPSPITYIHYLQGTTFSRNFSLIAKKVSISNIRDLPGLIVKNKHIPVELLTDILARTDFENTTLEEGNVLLQCCGEFTADANTKERDKICKTIFKDLLERDKININTFQTYIKVCTDNRVAIHTKELLIDMVDMKCKPDQKLYENLMENLCQNGNIEEAYSLLEHMKNEGFSADEHIFNNLAFAHAAKMGLESAETIVQTMKTAHVQVTNYTKVSILQGILKRGNPEDLKNFLKNYAFQLNENQLWIILKELGLSENISWLSEIKILYNSSNFSKEFPNHLRNICIHLVHMGKSMNAIKILENFMLGTENFGFFILEEMLQCKMDIDEIISLAQYIRDNHGNQYVFENLSELALKYQHPGAALKLFENLGELKPHYFWPLFLKYHQQSGEFGVIEVMKKMLDMSVKPDLETLESYVFPLCNLNDPNLLVDKFHSLGLTVKEVLSPILTVLLQSGETQIAAGLCSSYKVSITGQKLFELISSSWHSSRDGKSVATILQRFCESSRGTETDIVGDFLIMSLNHCRNIEDFGSFCDLLKDINEKTLRMTSSSADTICKVLDEKCDDKLSQQIRQVMDMLLDFRLKPEEQYIPHPKDMTLEELECHLIELEEKNMETRGVLRRLIQHHANSGNSERVKKLLERFLSAGYTETTGMKSMVMYNFIKGGHLQPALDVYNELKMDPTFSVDTFKVLDLATLLVKSGRFSQAMDILQERTKSRIFGGLALLRNCLELLRACENEQEQIMMFNYLIEQGFCKVSNVILGPLVKIHLKRKNVEKAVSVYTSLVDKYRCTPLQLELMKEVVRSNDEHLLQRVLDCTIKIHGKNSTQSVLIIALAEEGREKVLRKILTMNKLSLKNELKKRCDRLAKEGKVEALNILARCCERLPNEVIDISQIYESIMKIHSKNNDSQSALELYNFLVEKEIFVSKDLHNLLYNLLRHNNCELPPKFEIKNHY